MVMNLLDSLIEALQVLPGIGPRSARRIAFYLLQHNRSGAKHLSAAIDAALLHIGQCEYCHSLSETKICLVCNDLERDAKQLCVVESVADLRMMEQTRAYHGLYFVLKGPLSPLDGLGPREIDLDGLLARVAKTVHDTAVEEVILATNFTAEGEATAFVISEKLHHLYQHNVRVTRLARGVPAGGELEYVDPGTVAHALLDRRLI
jgi:recombination protein RecR